MSILYPHNQIAYDSAAAMLRSTGRAAVIHPTGTGKSFIGFQLCIDNPDATVCWLSPSGYIFKTQLENWGRAGGAVPGNIKFFTYARLMGLGPEELAAIRPGYIVLDEFHRAGAECWGQGVKNLLSLWPGVPLLGLSATAIRYLDNQRDMADELFSGNIASEITLGEAIVRGILKPPKYVLSVYSYAGSLEKYSRRLYRIKGQAARDEASRYLESLRRALEQAEGLDVLFEKHMDNPHGKYILFCSNYEHMQEMMAKSLQWFKRLDRNPSVYYFYSEDGESARSFDNFRADGDESHLRLLFCIDALNEGIHVDDIDGVILLRPTVSPIIYKQQIGRALSSGAGKPAVIFDIVMNIENLCSIGAIEDEMQVAVAYYRSLGQGDRVREEHFRILDELRDCRELFERLNDSLTASWSIMYSHAEAYYHERGNLEIPRRYRTPEGYSLGQWLFTQRKVYAGEAYGRLGAERIAKLESIGMVWGSCRDLSWERNFAAAKAYYESNGNLSVPAGYITPEGLCLGRWLSNLRMWSKNSAQQHFLSAERQAALDGIGMVWDVPDYLFQKYYEACRDYVSVNGNLDVPSGYVTADGLRLGQWLAGLRRSYSSKDTKSRRLTERQFSALSELGMQWLSPAERSWEMGYQAAREYESRFGNLAVPPGYITDDGYNLGRWLSRQRRNGRLSAEKHERLSALGMVWEKEDPWELRFALAEQYYKEHGNLFLPAGYKVQGIWLGKWLDEQRQIYLGRRSGRSLTDEQLSRLAAIGMPLQSRAELQWLERYESAREYYSEHGNLAVPDSYIGKDGKSLSSWVKLQRKYYREGSLSPEQKNLLDAVGMVWEFNDSWESGFAHAEAYYRLHGNLAAPAAYAAEDGFPLGKWLSNQRDDYKSGSLSPQRALRLESVGMRWRPEEESWETGYIHLQEYMAGSESREPKTQYRSPDGYRLGEWVRAQHRRYERGTMPLERLERLQNIGVAL